MPLITALAIFLIVGSLAILIANAEARQNIGSISPTANLLIPGLNPYLPLGYGWVALIVTIVIHEAGHGIIARIYNVKVDSTGLVLFLGLPIGAFVNIERDELNKVTLKKKSAILTAGPLNNMILAGLSLAALYFVITTLTPLPPDPNAPEFGIAVITVSPGSPAESVGLTQGSVIQSIASQETRQVDELGGLLRENLGNTVEITWVDSDYQRITKQVTLPDEVPLDQGVLGVQVAQFVPDMNAAVLERYKSAFSANPIAILLPPTMQQGAVPYSELMAPTYQSTLGWIWMPVANMLFWLWFVNFNVGIFNALPIGPLDGGQLYGSLIEKKVKSASLAKNAANLLTLITAAVVAAAILLPYLF